MNAFFSSEKHECEYVCEGSQVLNVNTRMFSIINYIKYIFLEDHRNTLLRHPEIWITITNHVNPLNVR